MNNTIELPAVTTTRTKAKPAAPRGRRKGYVRRSASHPACPTLGLLALGSVFSPAPLTGI